MLLLATAGKSQPAPRTMSRSLLHSTVRLEVVKPNELATGTGFLYTFQNETNDIFSIPVIVTCWHVVDGGVAGRFFISQPSTNASWPETNRIGIGIPYFQNAWIRHPDTNVDLAIMPIAPMLHALQNTGNKIDIAPLNSRLIPSEEEVRGYGVFQEVKFIGYPIGIWDEKNNLPVIRRGMTATDPVVDYNGKSEFLIDAAVFPGSSGSPVIIAEEGPHIQGIAMIGGSTLRFMGIVSECAYYTSDGKVEIVAIPSTFDMKVHTGIPANLGVVIKANRLNDFNAILQDIAKRADEVARRLGVQNTGSPGK
jgi:hypothetical protein